MKKNQKEKLTLEKFKVSKIESSYVRGGGRNGAGDGGGDTVDPDKPRCIATSAIVVQQENHVR
ncbi:hypothetical protein HN014_06050 [Aquimarina sp. TRL1]|uniref:hypothetical protein n=1 Tax=Aquimarina sp. (strain TRL1) TaxID=2736252 RepID=UPI00158861C3|nr:hypothetical protein [Aquimarina sp. TRL1]QKX04492.1 hypothetical protein HN014_06050 [Aquimarina sp. TRL1]